jgi:polyhydroxyalkanoate synthesis regulator protein
MRIIKTYTNGRFYDTLDKKYLSKDQLTALINKKEAIKVIMHKTGDDVTPSVEENGRGGKPPKRIHAQYRLP